jgi:hypothetical protein
MEAAQASAISKIASLQRPPVFLLTIVAGRTFGDRRPITCSPVHLSAVAMAEWEGTILIRFGLILVEDRRTDVRHP